MAIEVRRQEQGTGTLHLPRGSTPEWIRVTYSFVARQMAPCSRQHGSICHPFKAASISHRHTLAVVPRPNGMAQWRCRRS
jgi:hypothetical protein